MVRTQEARRRQNEINVASLRRNAGKPCSKCGKAPRPSYNSWCPDCVKEKPSYQREQKLASMQRRKGRPCTTCSKRPRTGYSHQCLECVNEVQKYYQRQSPQMRKTARRVSRKKYEWLREGTVTAKELQNIYKEADGKCSYCKRHIPVEDVCFWPSRPIGFDHIVAMRNGGRHDANNLALCHERCNIIKASFFDRHLLAAIDAIYPPGGTKEK